MCCLRVLGKKEREKTREVVGGVWVVEEGPRGAALCCWWPIKDLTRLQGAAGNALRSLTFRSLLHGATARYLGPAMASICFGLSPWPGLSAVASLPRLHDRSFYPVHGGCLHQGVVLTKRREI